jgi:ATP-dependent phosphofructokinase / diphosphate-dependent phosphofructokinase
MPKLLLTTGGGDCPGLNAVIRAIVKSAHTQDWKVYGSKEAFTGILSQPIDLMELTPDIVAGIHVKGGTILKTTNKLNPLRFPVKNPDGTITFENRIPHLVEVLKSNGFDAVINIGGDGSQKISQAIHKYGFPVIGVPKTIDNDLAATDYTFGFQTAVQTATECFDKLVSTAESHHRVMIMEVMGRDAGWIALHTAIAGGAEICLIPEIPYDIAKLVETIEKRYEKGRGFVNIVVAEGAKPVAGNVTTQEQEAGSEHIRLGGVAYALSAALKKNGCQMEIRETVLGHIQRGGLPNAFDRVLSTWFGVKAFELLESGNFGKMVAFRSNQVVAVELSEATRIYREVELDNDLLLAAKKMGIVFGD